MSFTIFQNEKTPFQAIKTTSSKSRKIDFFPKGLTHNFGPKMAIFPTFFFRQYKPGKCLLRYSRTKKTPFQAIKTTSSKSPKIDIFPKGLTHGVGPKMAIFSTFFFRQYKPGKCLLRYSRTKKTPFQAIKTTSSKSRKFDISPKGLIYGFGPKMAIFPTFFFRQNQPGKCLLRYSRTKKTPFQAIKTTSSKNRKIDIFPKGLIHGLGPRMAIFSTFFFSQNKPGKCLLRYSRTKKTPFQAIKTKTSKSRKIHIFPKGLTHNFGPKMAIFPTFFFRQYKRGKCLLRYSRTKKTPFQAIKTTSSKSRKIYIFPNGLTHGFGPKMAIFPNFFFRQYKRGKCLLRYSRTKKTPFQAIKTTSSKSRKIDIFPKGLIHGFGPKMAIFPTFFFQAI